MLFRGVRVWVSGSEKAFLIVSKEMKRTASLAMDPWEKRGP